MSNLCYIEVIISIGSLIIIRQKISYIIVIFYKKFITIMILNHIKI